METTTRRLNWQRCGDHNEAAELDCAAHARAHAEKAAEAAAGKDGEDVAEDERDQIKRQLLIVKGKSM